LTKKQRTATALRAAAVRLISERGYDNTSTADIAAAAGVTQRTFFNHFATKEAVIVTPDGLVTAVVADALRSRPPDEDVTTSLAVAAMEVAHALAALPALSSDPESQRQLMIATVKLMFGEPAVRQVFMERRSLVEDTAWQVLLERGVAPDDTAARTAVAAVVAISYLSLRVWADGGAVEPLPSVFARHLVNAPRPTRLATGVRKKPATAP
jgi:AcrR family transcriptional regulator